MQESDRSAVKKRVFGRRSVLSAKCESVDEERERGSNNTSDNGESNRPIDQRITEANFSEALPRERESGSGQEPAAHLRGGECEDGSDDRERDVGARPHDHLVQSKELRCCERTDDVEPIERRDANHDPDEGGAGQSSRARVFAENQSQHAQGEGTSPENIPADVGLGNRGKGLAKLRSFSLQPADGTHSLDSRPSFGCRPATGSLWMPRHRPQGESGKIDWTLEPLLSIAARHDRPPLSAALLRGLLAALCVALSLADASPIHAAAESGSEEQEETPGPGSEESPPLQRLPVPLLRPPEGMDFVPGAPASRAAVHLARVAAVLPLASRLVSLASERLGLGNSRGKVVPEDCAAAAGLQLLLGVANRDIWEELRTAQALLKSVAVEDSLTGALRTQQEDLAGRREELKIESRAIGRAVRRWRCGDEAERAARVLSLSAMAPELGARALLVEASEPHRVLWVDGRPSAVADESSWGIVLLRRDRHRVCESSASDTACRGGRVVSATGDALLPLMTR